MFNLGDKVWYAGQANVIKTKVCEDCFGKKSLVVILGDDTQIIIPCQGCEKRGDYYETYPCGYNEYYEWEAKAELVTINRVEIRHEKVEYGYDGNYCCDQDKMFLTEEEAKAKGDELSRIHTEEELKKLKHKYKNTRSWAWNLNYHRSRIKDAKRDLEYHSRQFEYTKTKVKEDKIEVTNV